jgi:hypothetical protein
MSIRLPSPRARSLSRTGRWPLIGACIWLFLMTLLGAELAGGDPAMAASFGPGEWRRAPRALEWSPAEAVTDARVLGTWFPRFQRVRTTRLR